MTYLRAQRRIVNPHEGFMSQLEAFDVRLQRERAAAIADGQEKKVSARRYQYFVSCWVNNTKRVIRGEILFTYNMIVFLITVGECQGGRGDLTRPNKLLNSLRLHPSLRISQRSPHSFRVAACSTSYRLCVFENMHGLLFVREVTEMMTRMRILTAPGSARILKTTSNKTSTVNLSKTLCC